MERNRMKRVLVFTALTATFLAAPAAVTSALLAWKLGASMNDCLPVENDEVHYWNEIACFVHAGLASGYCVDNEQPARATWTRFGPHGPGFPLVYGLPACVVGWQPTSGPFFNTAIIAVAACVWIALTRPDAVTLAVATVLIGTFWPVVIFLPTVYQEAVHYAIALVLAGLLRRALGGSWQWAMPFVALVIVASLIRLSWILVLIPWAVATFPGVRWPSKAFIALATVLGLAGAIWAFTVICSPYPDRLNPEIARIRESPVFAFWTLELRFERGWKQLLSPASAPPAGLLQRYQLVAIMVLGVGLLAWRKRPRHAAFAAVNVLVILLANMLFFDMWGNRDYRVIAPHLLLSLLSLLTVSWRPVLPFVLANAAFTGIVAGQFAEFHRDRTSMDRDKIAAVREELAPLMTFTPGADGWANTLFFPVSQHSYRLLALPPGVGLTFALTDEMNDFVPWRSRYVILPWHHAPSPRARFRLRAETSLGPLYVNPDYSEDGPAIAPPDHAGAGVERANKH
jgi:hypothetical protein